MARQGRFGKCQLEGFSVALLTHDFPCDFFRTRRSSRHSVTVTKPLHEIAILATAGTEWTVLI